MNDLIPVGDGNKMDDARSLRDALIAFARWVIVTHREKFTDVDDDGVAIQDKLQELGLLVSTSQQGPCGDECQCAAYGVDWPYACLRLKEGVLP